MDIFDDFFLFYIADSLIDLWDIWDIYAINLITDFLLKDEFDNSKDKIQQAIEIENLVNIALIKTLKKSDLETKKIINGVVKEKHDSNMDFLNIQGTKTKKKSDNYFTKNINQMYKRTNGEFKNLSQSMVKSSYNIFINACDKAIFRSQTGMISRQKAILDAIEETAKMGLYVTYPSGYRDSVEVAVRRAITTGAGQISGMVTMQDCKDNNINYVLVSAHLGARISDTNKIADHEGWQGKIYKLYKSDDHKDIPLLKDETGYDPTGRNSDPLGLHGYNCRHTEYPISDIDNFKNNTKKINKEENKKLYLASQKQRALEREMRRTRRDIEAMKEAKKQTREADMLSEINIRLYRANEKFEKQQRIYSEFCKNNNLTEQRDRLMI